MDPDVRAALVLVGLLFCALFGLMTITVVAQHGIDVLSIAAFAIVAMVMIGLLGALRGPPRR
jgi:hypothetical protein